MSTLDRCLVSKNPNGTISITSFIREAMRRDETEDQFIERIRLQLEEIKPQRKNLPYFIVSKQVIRDAVSSSAKGHKRRLRINANNKIVVDESVKTQDEINLERLNSLKSKLMSAQPLTEDEAKFLLRMK